jgi:capsid protein
MTIYSPSGRPARQDIDFSRQRSALNAGAMTGPNKGWLPRQHQSADAALLASNPDLLLARSRYLCDNDPLIYTIRERVVNHVIRNGAYPQFHFPASGQMPGSEVNTEWEESFSLWAEYYAHASGLWTYAMMQRIIVSTVFADGEVLIKRSFDSSAAGICPLRLNVLTIDHLDKSVNGRQSDGSLALRGVIYDQQGRFVGARLFPSDPALGGAFGQKSELVPADLLIHVATPRHASQRRGRPDIVPVMQLARDLELYQHYTIQKAKREAWQVGALKGGTGRDVQGIYGGGSCTDPNTGGSLSPVSTANWPPSNLADGGEVMLGESIFTVVPHGAEFVDFANNTPSAQHEAFCKVNGRRIGLAAGTGDLLATGNYDGYSFAGARSEALDRTVDLFCKQFCFDDILFKKINAWYVDACMLYGTNPTPLADYYKSPQKYWIKVKTRWSGEQSMNRYQDMTAAKMAIESNISNAPAEAAVAGGDFYENVEENKRARLATAAADYEVLQAEVKNAELVAKIKALSAGTAGTGAKNEQA